MAHRLKQRRLLAGLLAQIFSARLTSIQKSEYGSQRLSAKIWQSTIVCQRRKRRFWVKPGRTAAWWQNFLDNIVIPE